MPLLAIIYNGNPRDAQRAWYRVPILRRYGAWTRCIWRHRAATGALR